MIIDIVCLLLIGLIVWMGVRKGIFITVLHILAYVLAGVISRVGAQPIASFVYQRFLREHVMNSLNAALPSGSVGGSVNEFIDAAVQSIPEQLRAIAQSLGLLPSEETKSTISQVLTTTQLEQDYVSPIITKVLTFITMVLLFVVISVILRLVAVWVNSALFDKREGGILSTVNKIGGGALGLIKGVIPILFIGILLILIAPAIGNAFLSGQVEQSYLCTFLSKLLV